MLNNLENATGARKKRKIVGRGPGSTLGKTCGRGHKGQNSRSGSKRRIGFEGGQMPLHRRLPKRGFNNIFRKEINIVNLSSIVDCKKLDLSQVINSEVLVKAGLIRNNNNLLKILSDGEVKVSLKIEAHKFSSAAEKKIKEAGGEPIIVESYV